jgi:hypothetical protein
MRAPNVGIIYLVGDKLWIDATPVNRAMNVGDYVIHESDHQRYWKQLVKQGAAPDTAYEEYPRGRVSYNGKSRKFMLLADRCILLKENLLAAILLRMHLSARGTEIKTDSLYHCLRCLGRSR